MDPRFTVSAAACFLNHSQAWLSAGGWWCVVFASKPVGLVLNQLLSALAESDHFATYCTMIFWKFDLFKRLWSRVRSIGLVPGNTRIQNHIWDLHPQRRCCIIKLRGVIDLIYEIYDSKWKMNGQESFFVPHPVVVCSYCITFVAIIRDRNVVSGIIRTSLAAKQRINYKQCETLSCICPFGKEEHHF